MTAADLGTNMNIAGPGARLKRETFSTPRLAEFCTRQGLVAATGFGPEEWPGNIVKELVDNALDDAEEHGRAPQLRVEVADDRIVVADQGSGLPAEVLGRIIDYSRTTSARHAYVSPTRGAQGNALQTVVAAPFVLDGQIGRVTIEAHGLRHDLEFRINQVTRTPDVRRTTSVSSVKIGTETTVWWPASACSTLVDAAPRILQIVGAFAALNPHAAFSAQVIGDRVGIEPTDPKWTKWSPSAPTSPHWYDPERFERLIAANVAHGKGDRSVREFVAEFAGLSGTARQKQVVDATGLTRATLRRLCPEDRFDQDVVAGLLRSMQAHSRPLKPEGLGVIGRSHWATTMVSWGGQTETLQYRKILGENGGIPWVVEAAFCYAPAIGERRIITGINFSPALRNPFHNLSNGFYQQTLDGLLASRYVRRDEPVLVFVHLACPRLAFTDRGKAGVALPDGCGEAIAEAANAVTEKWRKQRKAEERHAAAALNRHAALATRHDAQVTFKDAAWQTIGDAYHKASGGGRLPTKPRQIMYAARPAILALTGKDRLDDQYFSQQLLPDFIEAHPEECAGWDIVWDARGHLSEPHTGKTVPLGTLEVRQYLAARAWRPGLQVHSNDEFPTVGPQYRFENILYIEKEGFDPLLASAQMAERFDLAIMSNKGMSVTASRLLLDRLAERIENVFVLHDFDISGFSILGTLGNDGRRYRFSNSVRIVDLGLRLADVEALNLQSEPIAVRPQEWAARAATLRRHGAAEAEIAFLGSRRVELNALTSPQFVEFVERRLAQHEVGKIIPETKILEAHWRRVRAERRAVQAFHKIRRTCEDEAAAAVPPGDLTQIVADILARNPTLSWDAAVVSVER